MTTKFDSSYHRAKYHEYRLRNMQYVAKGGPIECANCGSSESLEFDHIDPSLKSFNISSRKSLKSKEFTDELDKCQLLCRPCHEAKTASENVGFTHGTMYGFQHMKCPCEECEAKKREFYASRRVGDGRGAPYGRPSVCGEYVTYKRGCRCEDCRGANAAMTRRSRARKASANS